MPEIGFRPTTDYPRGGTTGQALYKSSDTEFATTWADPPPAFGPNLLSGLWYDPRFGTTTSAATFTSTSSTVWYYPVLLPIAITTSQVGVYVSTASSGTVNIGFNTMNTASTLLAPSTQLGYAAISVSAINFYSASLSLSLPAGWIYLAIGFSAAITVSAGVPSTFPSIIGVSSVASGDTDNPPWNHYQTGSAVPTTNPTTSSTSQRAATNGPIPFFKVA